MVRYILAVSETKKKKKQFRHLERKLFISVKE